MNELSLFQQDQKSFAFKNLIGQQADPRSAAFIIVSVTDAQFGADTTGIIDATAAFQAAHDSLPSIGGIIYIPPGSYRFNQTAQSAQFTISKSNVMLVGAGWASQLLKTNTGVVTGNQAIVMLRPLTGDISNIVLRDFRITGPTTNNGTAITSDSRVMGISLHDGASAHVISDVLHDGVLIEGMEAAAFTLNAVLSSTNNCRRVKYSNCWARNCRQDGFNDFASENEDIMIGGCYATDCDGYGMEMSSPKGLVISNNNIRRCGQSGIGIEYSATNSPLNQVLILGNKITDITTAAYTDGHGISLGQAQNPINTTIVGNAIARTGGASIFLSGSPDKLFIKDNTLKDPGKGGVYTRGIYGASAMVKSTITGNSILQDGAGYALAYGIDIAGAGSATNLIADNEISGYTVAAISTASPTRVVLAPKRITVAYSASMTFDASSGNEFDITATNNTAFTINAPTNVAGDGLMLVVVLRNASGGALGAATWNGVFKMSAWTNPANATSRSITFRWDGTNWIQIAQTGVDVPN